MIFMVDYDKVRLLGDENAKSDEKKIGERFNKLDLA
jgi:hypothetical protein